MATNYIASPSLKAAIDVAQKLNKPLLVSGEPGTGKTELAKYISETLQLELLRFNTKTTSVASDLFYMYDAVSHFRSSYDKNIANVSTSNFIELKAMGLAIASSLGAENAETKKINSIKNYYQVAKQPAGSVVLIDEIDKAPRDFPNDLLNELENYEFEIKEINQRVSLKGNAESKPLFVLMTSNNERVLPEPFLRRCIYYHIPFPDTEQLTQIVLSKGELKHLDPQKLTNAITYFKTMRDKVIQKKPATAELIDWIKILNIQGIFDSNIDFTQLASTQKEKFASACYALFKNKQDYDTIVK